MENEFENQEVQEAVVATPEGCVGDVLMDISKRYFDEKDEEKKAKLVDQLVKVTDKYAKLYDADSKFQSATIDSENRIKIADAEQQTRLKIAKSEVDSRIALAEIDSELRFNISKTDNETKLMCCEAECKTKKDISEAELKQKRNEMYIAMANTGINAALAGGAMFAGSSLISNAFAKEIGQNMIVGRATGTKMADKIGTSILTNVLRNCIHF